MLTRGGQPRGWVVRPHSKEQTFKPSVRHNLIKHHTWHGGTPLILLLSCSNAGNMGVNTKRPVTREFVSVLHSVFTISQHVLGINFEKFIMENLGRFIKL